MNEGEFMIDERLVRVARLPLSLRPLPIFNGRTFEPISCEWLGIGCVSRAPDDDQVSFLLYFLDEHGRWQEALPYETLQIALDQAHAVCGYGQDGWTTCDIPACDDGSYSTVQLRHALGYG